MKNHGNEALPVNTMSLLSEFRKVNSQFGETLKGFNESQLFVMPPDGGWSAALVAEHVIASDRSMVDLINGESVAMERAPDENIPALKKMFLDFNKKMRSPEFVVPHGIFKTKHEVVTTFESVVRDLQALTNTLDLSRTCLQNKVPEFKGSTRLELVYFTIVHTQRHLHQLGKIAGTIRNK
jgi:hypothetical protein